LLRLVRTSPASDLQAALEETVEAARKVRRDIEERIARALADLLQPHAPGPGSR
jgi:NTP pyrophosphatase (non-canonical NTP hydrolase)